jgi:predicted HicB family RNase H-like nuclease
MPRPKAGTSPLVLRVDEQIKRRLRATAILRQLSVEQLVEEYCREGLEREETRK